jgi:uncharacterized protein (TIGR00369 family)
MQIPDDFTQLLNGALDGWATAMDLRYLQATVDEVSAELIVAPKHLQAYGVVHGGVYCGVIEALSSVGAALNVMPHGLSVVGLENHTSFLRAVRGGTLRAVATPLARGRRSHVWEGRITDEAGRVVATGRVRLLCIDPSVPLAGERPELKGGPASD